MVPQEVLRDQNGDVGLFVHSLHVPNDAFQNPPVLETPKFCLLVAPKLAELGILLCLFNRGPSGPREGKRSLDRE
jgi:hypothetical protein